MARSFRVFCRHCGYKAYIKRSVREHADLTKLYCVCTNPSCNHSFVQNVEYAYTTRTSDLVQNDLILNLINNLSKDDKNKIFEHLQQKKPLKSGFRLLTNPSFQNHLIKWGCFFYFVAFLLLFLSDNGASGHFR